MVDSGNQYSSGPVNFYAIYKEMVDNSLLRPAQAAIEAYAWRDGDKVGFYAQLQNLSGVALSPDNWAAVHGIVYEDISVGVTSRYVRAVVSSSISNLEPGETSTFTFETPDLEGVNWEKLHYLVLVDYLPPGSVGAYDMLQAAQAVPVSAPFVVQPDPLVFLVDPTDSLDPGALLSFHGADFIYWEATEAVPWLSISPTSGWMDTHPEVTIDTAALSPGLQQATISFVTADGYFNDEVTARVYYGTLEHRYLPFVHR
jgi:hypothetical protein